MRQWIGMASALALAACGGGDDKADGNGSGGNASGGGGGGAGAAMQPGQWEVTTQVTSMNVPNMPAGMPQGPLPPASTVRICLTPEQAAQPGAGFFTGSGESGGCRYESSSMSGGRVEATVQCEMPGGTMRSTINGQFTATSYEVNQRVQTTAQGTTVNMESRTTGRRTGDCPA